jgi:hypothetical protein
VDLPARAYVDVRPAQRECFARSQPRIRHQRDKHAIAHARHLREDSRDFVLGEGAAWGCLWGSAEAEARVRREPASFDGRGEHRAECLHGEVHRPRPRALLDDPCAPLDDALPASRYSARIDRREGHVPTTKRMTVSTNKSDGWTLNLGGGQERQFTTKPEAVQVGARVRRASGHAH